MKTSVGALMLVRGLLFGFSIWMSDVAWTVTSHPAGVGCATLLGSIYGAYVASPLLRKSDELSKVRYSYIAALALMAIVHLIGFGLVAIVGNRFSEDHFELVLLALSWSLAYWVAWILRAMRRYGMSLFTGEIVVGRDADDMTR